MATDRRPGPNVWLLLRVGLIGGALARLLRSPGRFVIVALVGTALSLIPPVGAPDAGATEAVLVLTHLVAASIIIPLLRKQLRTPAHPFHEARSRS